MGIFPCPSLRSHAFNIDNPLMSSTANVDPAALAKFSDLAHRWWDENSEFRPLHQINPLRLGWINAL